MEINEPHFTKKLLILDQQGVLLGTRDYNFEDYFDSDTFFTNALRDFIFELNSQRHSNIVIVADSESKLKWLMSIISNHCKNLYSHTVIIVGKGFESNYIAELLTMGIKGIYSFDNLEDTVTSLLKNINCKYIYIDPKVIKENVKVNGKIYDSDELARRILTLSKSEKNVIYHFILGMKITEIANLYQKSFKTISGQKQAALRKLNIEKDYDLFQLKELIKLDVVALN